MSVTVIPVSDDYLLHVSVTFVSPINCYQLRVQSQWLAAKNPQNLYLLYAVTLPADQLAEIAAVINEGIA